MCLHAALPATPFADYIHKQSLMSTACLAVAAGAIHSSSISTQCIITSKISSHVKEPLYCVIF